MTHDVQRDPQSMISRRTLVHGLALAAGATAAGASGALAQTAAPLGPPSVVTTPPRDFSPRGAPTTYFWDPDIVAVDPSFNNLAQPNAPSHITNPAQASPNPNASNRRLMNRMWSPER